MFLFLIFIIIILYFCVGDFEIQNREIQNREIQNRENQNRENQQTKRVINAKTYFGENPPTKYSSKNRIKLFEKANYIFKNYVSSFFISRGSDLNVFGNDKELIKSATKDFDWDTSIKKYANLFRGQIYYKGKLISKALEELKADVNDYPIYDIFIIEELGNNSIDELEKLNEIAKKCLSPKGKLYILNFSITDCYTLMLRDIKNEITEKLSGKKIKTKNYFNYFYLDKIFNNFNRENSFSLTGFQDYGETIIVFKLNNDNLNDYIDLFRFNNLFEKNKEQTKLFLRYVAKRFNVSYKILEYMSRNALSDYEIYNYIRGNYDKKDFDKPYIKIESVPVKSAKKILDVGTERIEFLESLEKKFNADVKGINIKSGFCHYDENSISDKRFQYYDGKKIPFKDKSFDLVTIFSVMHHIPNANIPAFINEVCRVSSRYIFVKDVNLDSEEAMHFFDIQHELFEEVNTHGKSYKNSYLTFELVKKCFKKNNFNIENIVETNNFNKTFYVLFKYY